MPNTPRERLLGNNEMTARAATRMYIMLTDRNAQPDQSALLAVEIMRRLLAELDQANEGSGEDHNTADNSGGLDTRRERSVESESELASHSDQPGATVPQPPSPAPESVEGMVTRIESAGLPWTVVDVPDSWPIGTKVRIQRISE